MSLRCVIIDDEPSSQNVLKQFVGKVPFLSLQGVCNNALEAIHFLEKNTVDLLFLDINMPYLSGLSFYKSLPNKPLVIFTTAYAEYAIDGFNVNATDYLLKPFSFERFLKAVNKAQNILLNKKEQKYIMVKANKKLHQIAFETILYIEAFGDYIKIHLNDKFLVSYKTLNKIKELLPKQHFIQVHKSYIINKLYINFIEGNTVVLKNHSKIPLGQKFKAPFLNAIT